MCDLEDPVKVRIAERLVAALHAQLHLEEVTGLARMLGSLSLELSAKEIEGMLDKIRDTRPRHEATAASSRFVASWAIASLNPKAGADAIIEGLAQLPALVWSQIGRLDFAGSEALLSAVREQAEAQHAIEQRELRALAVALERLLVAVDDGERRSNGLVREQLGSWIQSQLADASSERAGVDQQDGISDQEAFLVRLTEATKAARADVRPLGAERMVQTLGSFAEVSLESLRFLKRVSEPTQQAVDQLYYMTRKYPRSCLLIGEDLAKTWASPPDTLTGPSAAWTRACSTIWRRVLESGQADGGKRAPRQELSTAVKKGLALLANPSPDWAGIAQEFDSATVDVSDDQAWTMVRQVLLSADDREANLVRPAAQLLTHALGRLKPPQRERMLQRMIHEAGSGRLSPVAVVALVAVNAGLPEGEVREADLLAKLTIRDIVNHPEDLGTAPEILYGLCQLSQPDKRAEIAAEVTQAMLATRNVAAFEALRKAIPAVEKDTRAADLVTLARWPTCVDRCQRALLSHLGAVTQHQTRDRPWKIARWVEHKGHQVSGPLPENHYRVVSARFSALQGR